VARADENASLDLCVTAVGHTNNTQRLINEMPPQPIQTFTYQQKLNTFAVCGSLHCSGVSNTSIAACQTSLQYQLNVVMLFVANVYMMLHCLQQLNI
jgi:hypothetical protein